MTTEFKPEYMRMSVLTAALQELTPREKRKKDPDLAIEDWIRFGPRGAESFSFPDQPLLGAVLGEQVAAVQPERPPQCGDGFPGLPGGPAVPGAGELGGELGDVD